MLIEKCLLSPSQSPTPIGPRSWSNFNAGSHTVDLARKLETFRDYYNDHRVHRAIAGLTPAQFAGALSPAPAALDHYGWQQHCRGLFEIPVAA
jgi:transposase InsO family protein